MLASVSVSAGELDGKQIFCDSDAEWLMYLDEERGLDVIFPPWGFVFQNGAVTAHFFDRSTDRTKAMVADEGAYSAAPTYVTWGKHPKLRSLNRKKLVVQYGAYEAECQLTSSLKAFQKMMQAAESEVQKEMDAKRQEQREERDWLMRDNKI
ncbi:hypothetical protein N8723_03850 [Luminiphilus sp.]|nr:hypothetical protein [Luminiphilus sp.]